VHALVRGRATLVHLARLLADCAERAAADSEAIVARLLGEVVFLAQQAAAGRHEDAAAAEAELEDQAVGAAGRAVKLLRVPAVQDAGAAPALAANADVIAAAEEGFLPRVERRHCCLV